MYHAQGRIFEFTLVNSKLTRVDTIPFTTCNVTKFYLSRFRLLIWVDSKLWYKSIPKLSKFEYSTLIMPIEKILKRIYSIPNWIYSIPCLFDSFYYYEREKIQSYSIP